ncbi:YlbL family protein [Knoellia sp. Soil729]|uniref:YlbL family protein n=1 Tax=Knoellia sp. Soil729 TaxID=1736394 RepID=UPI000AF95A89|nr:PDZ domain-containing protein [Knoellia sp. Soil729]
MEPRAPHDLAAPQPGPYAVSRRSSFLVIGLFVVIALGVGLSFVSLPYVVLSPGPITNTLGQLDGKPIVEIKGERTYPAKGALDFTTVRVDGGPGVRVDIFDLVTAAVRDDEEVFTREEIYPQKATREEVQQENTAEMVNSQEVAAAIALRETGHVVPERVTVSRVPDGSPAKGVLEPGDEFVSVAGQRTPDAAAVQAAVRSQKPGSTVPVVVKRDGVDTSVSVTTRDNRGTTVIGVLLGRNYDLPVDVTIDSGGVGGPSAGTMFTLAVYDLLTPGDLTAGKRIAGTGTMEPDESVGPIGGIRQKLHGARDGGADYFLAPTDNCDEVKGHVPDGLTVVRIGSFNDALGAVKAIAADKADTLPGC